MKFVKGQLTRLHFISWEIFVVELKLLRDGLPEICVRYFIT